MKNSATLFVVFAIGAFFAMPNKLIDPSNHVISSQIPSICYKSCEQIMDEYNRSIHLSSTALAHHNLGDSFLRSGKYASAIAEYTRAILIEPRYAGAYHQRALSKDLSDDKAGAAADYLKCTTLVPNFEPAFYNLAIIKDDAGDADAALLGFTHCIDMQPDAVNYWTRAELLHSLSKDTQALSDCDRSISLDAQYAPAYSTRGDVLHSQERTDDAIHDYTQAIKLDPSDPHSWIGRGDAFLSLDDGSKAISDFDQALRLDPENDYIFWRRGRAWQLTDEKKAITDYTRSLDLNPKRAEVYRIRGWLCSNDLQTAPMAIEDSNKYIGMEPSDFWGYLTKGFAHLRLNNGPSAVSDFTAVLSIVSRDSRSEPGLGASAYRTRGLTYGIMKNYDAALEDFNQSIKLQPENGKTYDLRGHTRYLSGDKVGAFADWATSIRITPTDSDVYNRILKDLAGRDCKWTGSFGKEHT